MIYVFLPGYIALRWSFIDIKQLLYNAYKLLEDKNIELVKDVKVKTELSATFLTAPGSEEPLRVSHGNAEMELSCILTNEEYTGYKCLLTHGADKELYEVLAEIADNYEGFVDGDPELLDKYRKLIGDRGLIKPDLSEKRAKGIHVSEKLAELCEKLEGIIINAITCETDNAKFQELFMLLKSMDLNYETVVVSSYGPDIGAYYILIYTRVDKEQLATACVTVYEGEDTKKYAENLERKMHMLTLPDSNEGSPISIQSFNNEVVVCVDSFYLTDIDDVPKLLEEILQLTVSKD